MPTIWITRHGERIDFIEPDWGASAADPRNPYLSPNGHVQARDLAERLKPEGIRHIFASPFLRTLQTADAVAEALELPIKVERGAGEMLKAAWFPEGDPRTWPMNALAAQFPRIDATYVSSVNPLYPEDWEQCQVRAHRTIHALVDRFEGDFLVVGHGATYWSLANGLVEDFAQIPGGCCSLIKLVRNARGVWKVAFAGETSYLSYREPQYRLN